MNESTQHGEETAAGGVDGGGIRAVFCDIRVSVEEVIPWDTHVIKSESTVVDAVQATFETIVFGGDTCKGVALIVAEVDVKAVSWAKTTASLP